MGALFTYNASYFFKKWTSYLLFAFPALILLGFGLIPFGPNQDSRVFSATIFMFVYLFALVIINIMMFGSNFLEIRKTGLLKRLGITRLTKLELFIGYALWYVFLDIILFFFLFALMGIFVAAGLYNPMQFYLMTWTGFIWGMVMFIVLSLSIGLLFATISKSFAMFNFLSTIYLILTIPLFVVPFTLAVANVQIVVLHIFFYIVPTSFVMEFLVGAWNGANVWSIANGYYLIGQVEATYVGVAQTNLDIWLPIGYVFGIAYLCKWRFTWDAK